MAVIFGMVLLAGFLAISVSKRKRHAADDDVQSGPQISAQHKNEIRRFWEVYRRATGFMRQGAWQEAAADYRQALSIDPGHEDSLYYLGNVMFELNQYDDAVSMWRQLIEVNPLSTRAHIQLGAVHSCGAQGAPFDLEIAEREFQRAHSINKEETGPVLKLGEVYLLKGQREQALTYFATAMQTNAKSIEAQYLTGYLEWQRGDRQAAQRALQQAARLSQAKLSAAAPTREGDTRTPGGGPILTEGASRRSFFARHWMALKTWERAEVSVPMMEAEYKKLDQQLSLLIKDAE
ncbi:MAG: tetratricopeptide repeat protein [Candidatus Krumholzibacteria bacterium]|nr:tetratricopeptide repeat protein [Candidatus Krumholzibacteria bacterium]